MKFLQVILSLSLLLLLVESSALNDTLVGSITRGSSLSTSFLPNSTSHWLSPSGNIAFGFYHLPCPNSSPYCPDRYVVGIWFDKSPFKTLVWTADHNDLHRPSSIIFTNEGKLVVRIMPDNVEEPLIPNVQEPVSYAVMHDNGNFVLYGSESQVVWESFDHPTDTIVGGQKLRPGVDLVSSGNRLSVQQTDDSVAIYTKDSDQGKISADCFRNSRRMISEVCLRQKRKENSVSVISKALEGSLSRTITLSLDTTGDLCLVGSDDAVLKYLYRNKNQQQRQQKGGSTNLNKDVHIYRATLGSDGHFHLYQERIDGNLSEHEKSSILVWPLPAYHLSAGWIFAIIVIILVIAPLLLCLLCCIIDFCCCCCWRR